MGLTTQSTGPGVLLQKLAVQTDSPDDLVIALAGNPNTGKSTVFNSLTGLRQHTGNWPGKTVSNAQGRYSYAGRNFVLIDLPGTYSILSNSVEEEVARDFICFGQPEATVVVTDATNLERNLNLVLQVLELTERVVVCVNLLDEARRKEIEVDLTLLSRLLGVPVVGTNARDGEGLIELQAAILAVASGQAQPRPLRVTYRASVEQAVGILEPLVERLTAARWTALRLLEGDDSLSAALAAHFGSDLADGPELEQARSLLLDHGLDGEALRDEIVTSLVRRAEEIAGQCVTFNNAAHDAWDRRIDQVVTSRRWGIPIMLGLLSLVYWITIVGANYPSGLLAAVLFRVEGWLARGLALLAWPAWLQGLLVEGVYRTLAWVVAVMLPPMAIFFPLFTVLEDLGYLPRVAFNLDSFFRRASAHGKQALTMCMGFGCNAAGVIGCRIIDSPRERLIAILTNNFVPCNGRFPTLIALSMIFIAAGMAGAWRSILAALSVLAVVVLGVLLTLLVSRLLSRTLLKGLPSSFTLELPPYRRPQVGRILVRSLLDRTLFVLGRAVSVAAPAGAVIWLMANLTVGELSVLEHSANLLQPVAQLIGLDGHILLAFILGLPANEIVIPLIIMSYLRSGSLLELQSLAALRDVLVQNGWTWLTAVCTMIFSLSHWPCGTTLLTIRQETQSWKWTLLAGLIPTLVGATLCFLITQLANLLALA
ncbi:MAG: ferrous iron transport protein B [Bacillota bacterium]|jgi:ferrous iron transport protein B